MLRSRTNVWPPNTFVIPPVFPFTVIRGRVPRINGRGSHDDLVAGLRAPESASRKRRERGQAEPRSARRINGSRATP